MRIIIKIFFFCAVISVKAQSNKTIKDSESKTERSVKTLDWLKDLNEKGLEQSGDSIIIGKEFQRLLDDEAYRTELYPEDYTWEQAIYYIKTEELKKAFWFLINIYPQSDKNKELVLRSIITYDQLVKMDEVIINTFYTYSFIDPKISIIKNGKPEIIRPDILEEKLLHVKEIVTYLKHYRVQNNLKKD